MTIDPRERPIRSFVLRQGRISAAQQAAHRTLLPKYGIEYTDEVLDLDRAFGRSAPKIIEIGFGMGETTAVIAAAHPEADMLAIDVHTPGVGGLLKLIDAGQLKNVKVIQHDAVEVLRDMIPSRSIFGVHLFFPDPWPKKRHHKRRLVQREFVALVCDRLIPGGYFHAATDWEDYAEHMLGVLSREPQLVNTASDYASRPDYRPLTKFENRGLKLGHAVWDLVFRKQEDLQQVV